MHLEEALRSFLQDFLILTQSLARWRSLAESFSSFLPFFLFESRSLDRYQRRSRWGREVGAGSTAFEVAGLGPGRAGLVALTGTRSSVRMGVGRRD